MGSNGRPYVGRFVAWDGGCLLMGRGGAVVPVHAHYAIQIAFGVTPGIQFRAHERDPWCTYDVAIIPSRQPHSMDASAVEPNVVIFVEPETREGRAIAERYLRDGIAAVPARALSHAMSAMFTAWHGPRTDVALRDAARGVVRTLTGGVDPTVVSDERILRACAYIRARVDRSLTLEEVAAEACLSPSRFRHLFVEQTGMGLRQYVLWRRFLRVWELLTEGASLSAAAHAAGFADAAHLSRTSRATFGFPPSAMQVTAPRDDRA